LKGCGLTGIAVSKLSGAEIVVLTDYDPGCIDILEYNISKNNHGQFDGMIDRPLSLIPMLWIS
jgi:predicted nicotinamide N-methyase